jgi:hypothetical protein
MKARVSTFSPVPALTACFQARVGVLRYAAKIAGQNCKPFICIRRRLSQMRHRDLVTRHFPYGMGVS